MEYRLAKLAAGGAVVGLLGFGGVRIASAQDGSPSTTSTTVASSQDDAATPAPDRADDVYRHRFTAAHEVGHLLLHGDCVPGDIMQEKEADSFAAEFLTPGDVIRPELPPRMDLKALEGLGKKWGVSVESLIYRCREVGTVSEPAYRRAYQRLNQLRKLGLFAPEPVEGYPGEVPVMISRAFALAKNNGLTMTALARELALPLPRLRLLLGDADGDTRPQLRLV